MKDTPVVVTKVDDYAFKMKFAGSYGLFIGQLASAVGQGIPAATAKHYLSKFHVKYAKKEDLDKIQAELKLDNWWSVYANRLAWSNVDCPRIWPWVVTKAPPDNPMIDLVTIGRLCRERGVLLCVDSIQGLGALPLDVRECQIDFLANGGHKWLLGPEGTGLFFCRQELIARLTPAVVGWCSVQAMDDYYRYDSPLREDATRWEIGCSNFIGRIGLGAGIRLLQEVGIENIEQRIFDLNDYLIIGLQKKGYRVTSPIASRVERSGILCFNHPAREAKGLFASLMAAKVAVSLRGQVIRVAPHFYNNEEDLDRLLLALPA